MTAQEIKTLAAAVSAEDETVETHRIYVLQKLDAAPASDGAGRIGGRSIGVAPEQYPLFDGKPMVHLATLDLNRMPELRTGALADKSALALFISSKKNNNANEASLGNEEAKVLLLSVADSQKGESSGKPFTNESQNGDDEPDFDDDNSVEARAYEATAIDVPKFIFENSSDEELHAKLFEAVFNSAYAGGEPVWLQGGGYEGQFVFQFDAKLIDVDLGDNGIMYVFTDTAFWQCY